MSGQSKTERVHGRTGQDTILYEIAQNRTRRSLRTQDKTRAVTVDNLLYRAKFKAVIVS